MPPPPNPGIVGGQQRPVEVGGEGDAVLKPHDDGPSSPDFGFGSAGRRDPRTRLRFPFRATNLRARKITRRSFSDVPPHTAALS